MAIVSEFTGNPYTGKPTDKKSNFNEDASDVSDNLSSSNEGSSNISPSGESNSNDSDTKYGSASSGSSFRRGILSNNREDRRISGAKCAFLTLLLLAAAALATTVFYITTQEEQTAFTSHFYDAAREVIKSSDDNVRGVFEAYETLSKTVTSRILEEMADGKQYPPGFVTLPNAEHIIGNARKISKALGCSYHVIVEPENREAWLNYSKANIGWWRESWAVEPFVFNGTVEEVPDDYVPPLEPWELYTKDADGNDIIQDPNACRNTNNFEIAQQGIRIRDPSKLSLPMWTVSPPFPPSNQNVNLDFADTPWVALPVNVSAKFRQSTFHDTCIDSLFAPGSIETIIIVPVFEHFDEGAPIVGYFSGIVPWITYFLGELSEGTAPLLAVVESSCGGLFSIEIKGRTATMVSTSEDLHDEQYHDIFVTAPFAAFAKDTCDHVLTIYPTSVFEEQYLTETPIYYMVIVLAIFVATSVSFLIFDCLVTRRQKSLMTTARKQNAIVSSLFPKSIQKQLMDDLEEGEKEAKMKWNKSGTAGLRSYLNDGVMESGKEGKQGLKTTEAEGGTSKPIADLFPETTIIFADIAGFTAWSSTREPSQVFRLLETVYSEFDSIAKRRRVYKVEVVGDCYVAVAGLPDPRPDHAVVMAKFASDCLKKMDEVTQHLERELGPDTCDLLLRIGLHSGPVVAGVLRGDKSRFQLFGDTMNTTARMESHGVANCIHVSQETASLLIGAGKEKWLTPREDKITAKGKGMLNTYFVHIPDKNGDEKRSESCSKSSDQEELSDTGVADAAAARDKMIRTAEWTVEVMSSLLKTMIVHRKLCKVKRDHPSLIKSLEELSCSHSNADITVLDEVADYIVLPDHDGAKVAESGESLDVDVLRELRDYVQTIAALYNDNPFHNFDHANHVVMSVNKLLSRIIAPDLDIEGDDKKLHDHTYGITSDPLTWFACVFSALIHDVDHCGVPNAQLIKEGATIATFYNGKSVAEQNSFCIAWDLLLEPAYKKLRATIYTTEAEFKRFRQLVINSVMATDIVDKDLKTKRNSRWDRAFDSSESVSREQSKLLKATIVIEHLIQASDVAHTMQHWHIYRRWNEKFFIECYKAYLEGRADSDPAETWYTGEIGFFDFYIIPLAKKLQNCGVFGVSSDEYLSYALQNRREWEERGEEIVQGMIKAAQANHFDMCHRSVNKEK